MENTGTEVEGVDGVDGVGGEGQGDGVGGGGPGGEAGRKSCEVAWDWAGDWAGEDGRGEGEGSGREVRTSGNLSRFLHRVMEVVWGVKEVCSGVGMTAGVTLGAGDRGVGVVRTGIISP